MRNVNKNTNANLSPYANGLQTAIYWDSVRKTTIQTDDPIKAFALNQQIDDFENIYIDLWDSSYGSYIARLGC